uniref:Uncharacterized protein n=1 Tax=Arundo donax TaxID=35708 RepID=A0A0A9G879_ARUDO
MLEQSKQNKKPVIHLRVDLRSPPLQTEEATTGAAANRGSGGGKKTSITRQYRILATPTSRNGPPKFRNGDQRKIPKQAAKNPRPAVRG